MVKLPDQKPVTFTPEEGATTASVDASAQVLDTERIIFLAAAAGLPAPRRRGVGAWRHSPTPATTAGARPAAPPSAPAAPARAPSARAAPARPARPASAPPAPAPAGPAAATAAAEVARRRRGQRVTRSSRWRDATSLPRRSVSRPMHKACWRASTFGERSMPVCSPVRPATACSRPASTCASARSPTGSAAASCPTRSRVERSSRTSSSTSSTCERRRGAGDQPPVPHPAHGVSSPARGAARQGEPEELDRSPRRLHPGDHRRQLPLRRDRRRATRGGSVLEVVRCRSPCGCARAGAQPAPARDRGHAVGSPTTSCARSTRDDPLLDGATGPCPSERFAGDDGLFLGLDLRGDATGRVGYRARDHTRLLDMATHRRHSTRRYWEPVEREPGDRVVLDPERFYLLLSDEAVRIPPGLRGRDDRLRPHERRAAHPLRRLLRPGVRLRPRRRASGLAGRARGRGPTTSRS